MGVGAVVGMGAATIGSAVIGAKGAKSAANSQAAAARYAADVERWKTERGIELSAPQRQLGNSAMNVLGSAFIPGWKGLITEGQNTGTGKRMKPITANRLAKQFDRMPGNRFLMNEAMDQVQSRAAVTGSAVGGNALSAISDRTRAMVRARSLDPLFQLAGYGTSGAGMAANALAGNREGDAIYAGGVGAANAKLAGTAAITGALNSGVSNWLTYQGLQPPSVGTPTPTPTSYASPSPSPAASWGAQNAAVINQNSRPVIT